MLKMFYRLQYGKFHNKLHVIVSELQRDDSIAYKDQGVTFALACLPWQVDP
jgi:hypothetical protein